MPFPHLFLGFRNFKALYIQGLRVCNTFLIFYFKGGKFAFSIYDFEGNETMDMFYLGDCLRALNLNPTCAQVEKMGGTKKKGKLLISYVV